MPRYVARYQLTTDRGLAPSRADALRVGAPFAVTSPDAAPTRAGTHLSR